MNPHFRRPISFLALIAARSIVQVFPLCLMGSIRESVVEWYMFDKRLKKLCGVGRIRDDNVKCLTQHLAGRKAPPS